MISNKRSQALLLSLLLAGGTAAQADQMSEWSGVYAGFGGGPEFDHSKWQATSVGPNNVYGVDPTTGTYKLDDTRGRMGGFVGWQMVVTPQLLAGVEGDIYGIIASNNHNEAGLPGVTYGGVTPADYVSEKQNFDASLRGRIGTWIEPNTLVYGTAGVAFRDLDFKANCPGGSNSWCGVPESADQSKTLVGYTVGVGAESKIAPELAVRLEYRYSGYGNTNIALFTANNQGADQTSNKIDLTTHIVTVGIVYNFGM